MDKYGAIHSNVFETRGLSFSLERGVPKLQKVVINKIETPYFRNKNFDPPTTDTPYPLNRLKIVLKSSFWTK